MAEEVKKHDMLTSLSKDSGNDNFVITCVGTNFSTSSKAWNGFEQRVTTETARWRVKDVPLLSGRW